LKSIYHAIDRFCYKHNKFGIPRLMLWIIGGSLAAFIIMMMDSSGTFLLAIMFSPGKILQGEVWRLITWIFLPMSDNLIWFGLSLYFYYIIGSALEHVWGRAKFTLYYLTGVLLHIIFGFALYFINGVSWLGIDATDLNLSLFLAFAVLHPDNRVLLFFIIPIKMWWLAAFDLLIYAYRIIMSPLAMKALPVLCLLCFLMFTWVDFIEEVKRRIPRRRRAAEWREEVHHAEQSAGFGNTIKNADSFSERKCAVCGKKASEYPEIEFRYCSRCEGLHCFCEEHINSHVHFTE